MQWQRGVRRHLENQEHSRHLSLCWHKESVAEQTHNLQRLYLVPLRLDSSSLNKCWHKLTLRFSRKHKCAFQCVSHHKCINTKELWVHRIITSATLSNLSCNKQILICLWWFMCFVECCTSQHYSRWAQYSPCICRVSTQMEFLDFHLYRTS